MVSIRWTRAVISVIAVMVFGALRADLVLADTTRNPTDDTFVRVTEPAINFDEDSFTISVTAEGFPDGEPEDIGYLRFDVSGLSGTLTNATLRVYNRLSPGPSVTVAVLNPGSDDWNGAAAGLGDETTLTFDNAPAPLGGTQLDTQDGSAVPAWMEFNSAALTSYVSDQIAGDETVTFVLRVTTTGFADLNFFEDREDTAMSGNLPELVLEGVDEALAVVMTDLSGERSEDDKDVLLTWQTISEFKHAGFQVIRQAPDGSETVLTPALIPPAVGGELGGASYRYIDHGAPSTHLRYWLEDVDIFGGSTRHGPVDIAAPVPRWRTLPLPPSIHRLKPGFNGSLSCGHCQGVIAQ